VTISREAAVQLAVEKNALLAAFHRDLQIRVIENDQRILPPISS
jgi:hypothetical protein